MTTTLDRPRTLAVLLALFALACGRSADDADIFVSHQALGTYNFSDHVAWSQSPPGGLSASQVPQFVQLGFDDNLRSGLNTTPASGMTWATNFFRNKRNPAGNGNAATFDNAPVRASFYSNSTYISDGFVEDPVLVKQSWHAAIVDGHETGNHTHTHPDGGGSTTAQWSAEIDACTDWLTRAFVAGEPAFSIGSGPGLARMALEGFRAPFLSYNTNLFSVLKSAGFTYDISIEEGWQLSDDGVNFNWPYTLDNGSPGGTAVGRPSGNQTGLWELGAAPFAIPPALRSQLGLSKITGLDFNMFVSANLAKAQALDILKYSLDQRLANNRAPLFIGAHTNIYTDAVVLPNTTAQQRREVIEEFVNYALGKPAVRIVTAKNVITWMRNPVALGGACVPEPNATFCSRLGKNCGAVTGTDNCGAPRTVSSCGTCTSPQTCGGGGTANVCGGGTTTPDRTEGGAVSATGTACNANEVPSNAYDNQTATKWCVTAAPSTGTPVSTVYDFAGTAAFAINSYTITTANDQPNRDPKNWTLQGCQGTCTAASSTGWVTLDTRTNQFAGAARFQTNTYSFTNTTAFQQFRLRFTANNGNTTRFQLAEIQLFGNPGGCAAETNAQFCARLGKNCGSVTAPDNCGNSRTVSSCGTCAAPQSCGGGGVPNVCGATGAGNCGAAAWSSSATYANGSVVTASCTVQFLECAAAEVGHRFAWRCVGADPNWCSQFQPGSGQNYNGIWTQLEQCN